MTKLTCMCLTFNEEVRLPKFLRHAVQWADEVVVIDKGSSDATQTIAKQFGVRLEVIPFSRQGYEDVRQNLSFSSNDWIIGLTPGEVPTRAFIKKIKTLIQSPRATEIDVICFPVKLYSFGVHIEGVGTPWSLSLQPRMFNRTLCEITNVVHDHVRVTPRSVKIPYEKDTFVFHPTHPGFESFIRSHTDYACATSDQTSNKVQEAQKALTTAEQFNLNWQLAGKVGLKQSIAWKVYWYMVALACLSKDDESQVRDTYSVIADEMLQQHWPVPD